MTEQEKVTRRNLAQSRWVVLMAFAINTLLNIVLIGIFARFGGLELVGLWAFLNAILMVVLLGDLGLTNSLTFRISRDGLATIVPMLRTLLTALATLALIFALAAPIAWGLAGTWGVAFTLTVLAGLAQLASNWLIAIRMGQHEQYWFNIKTVLRAIVQSTLAVTLLLALPEQPEFAFGLALALGGAAEVVFAGWLNRSVNIFRGSRAALRKSLSLMREFGLLFVAQGALDPFARLVVGTFGDAAALGTFTAARRIPVVVDQAVSQALRALLPGFARMTGPSERSAVHALLRDAIAGQAVMVMVPVIVIAIHAESLLVLWLGQASAELIAVLRVLALGTAINTLTMPFYWLLQGFGATDALARIAVIRLAVTLALSLAVLAATSDIVSFALIYAVSQVFFGIASVYLVKNFDGIFCKVLRIIHLGWLGCFVLTVLLANVVAYFLLQDTAHSFAFVAAVAGNLVLSVPIGYIVLRRVNL